MKRRYVIVVAVLAILVALWFLQKSRQPTVTSLVQTTPSSQAAADTTVPSAISSPKPDSVKLKPKNELMREALSQLNHKNIEFYGKVVDQAGIPIPSAEVNGQIIYNSGFASGVSKPKTVTDANGLFSFTGEKGRTLDFNIFKTGYQFMPEGDAFHYTELVPDERRHHPDPQRPVLLKMWKLQGAEPLIHSGKSFDLPPDGTPVHIDLMARTQVPSGGDLIVTLKHEVWPHGTIHHPYDWRATIEAIDGGLLEDKSRVKNLAPEEGYVPNLVFEESADQRPLLGGVNTECYVKLRGNTFGKLNIHINPSPGSPPSYIGLGWYINPKLGSRNLEYEPKKQVSDR